MDLIKLVLIIGILCVTHVKLEEDLETETCQWKPDGTKVCGDGEDTEEPHFVWNEQQEEPELAKDKSTNMKATTKAKLLKLLSKKSHGLARLNLEFVFDYAFDGSDENLETFSPAQVVKYTIEGFNKIDTNNDGRLSKSEIQAYVEGRNVEDAEVELILEEYTENKINILDYLKILEMLQEDYPAIFSPFEVIAFLSPVEIKKVILESAKIFLESDVDKSNGLNKEEFVKSLERPENKRQELLTPEQRVTIFELMDVNKDGEVVYSEFQASLPQKPKDFTENIKGIFKLADQDKDGFLSEEEFEDHLKAMSAKMNKDVPEPKEVVDGFNQLDKDSDGRISEQEMTGVIDEIEKVHDEKAAQAFNEMDTDGDGVLSRGEMEAMTKIMEQRAGQEVDVDLFINMLDKNSDGVIQLDEVKAMVKRMIPTKGQ